MDSFAQVNIHAYEPPHLYGIHRVKLFSHEETDAEMVILPAGGEIPAHRHGGVHEIFDVVAGSGRFVIDSRPVPGEAGKCVFVPAGTEHSLHNLGDEPWILRVTAQRQVYPRHLGRLLGRALRKRLRIA